MVHLSALHIANEDVCVHTDHIASRSVVALLSYVHSKVIEYSIYASCLDVVPKHCHSHSIRSLQTYGPKAVLQRSLSFGSIPTYRRYDYTLCGDPILIVRPVFPHRLYWSLTLVQRVRGPRSDVNWTPGSRPGDCGRVLFWVRKHFAQAVWGRSCAIDDQHLPPACPRRYHQSSLQAPP